MFDIFDPIDLPLLRKLYEATPGLAFTLNATSDGLELYIKKKGKVFKLYTQRNAVRKFKSQQAATTFLSSIGVKRVTIENIQVLHPDAGAPKKK